MLTIARLVAGSWVLVSAVVLALPNGYEWWGRLANLLGALASLAVLFAPQVKKQFGLKQQQTVNGGGVAIQSGRDSKVNGLTTSGKNDHVR